MTREMMLNMISRDGFCIVRDVVTKDKCEAMKQAFWEYLKVLSKGRFDPDDRATWIRSKNLPLDALIQHYNVAFQRHAVDARMALVDVFRMLWDTPNVIPSLDGTSFSFKGKRPNFRDVKDWESKRWTKKTAVHVDQTGPGFQCVQGGLAITSQQEDGHCFVCVPGSHKHHDELMRMRDAEYALEVAQVGKDRAKPLKKDWMIVSETQGAFLRAQGLNMQRVPLEAGDLVLWDSRTVHASTGYCKSAEPDAMRIHVFVCMKPAPTDPGVLEVQVQRRTRAHKEGTVGRHLTAEYKSFGGKPRIHCKEEQMDYLAMEIPASVQLSKEEKRVHFIL